MNRMIMAALVAITLVFSACGGNSGTQAPGAANVVAAPETATVAAIPDASKTLKIKGFELGMDWDAAVKLGQEKLMPTQKDGEEVLVAQKLNEFGHDTWGNSKWGEMVIDHKSAEYTEDGTYWGLFAIAQNVKPDEPYGQPNPYGTRLKKGTDAKLDSFYFTAETCSGLFDTNGLSLSNFVEQLNKAYGLQLSYNSGIYSYKTDTYDLKVDGARDGSPGYFWITATRKSEVKKMD